jgi:hypothetical protein
MTDPEDLKGQSGEGTPDVGEGTIPEFLNKKFKNVEEQAKAYNEAERQMHDANRRAKEAEDALAKMKTEQANIETGEKFINYQEQNKVSDPNFLNRLLSDPQSAINEQVEKRVNERLAPFYQAQRRIEVREEIREVIAENPDFPEIKDVVMQKLEEYPELKVQRGGLKMALALVRKDQYEKIIADKNAERIKREKKGELSGSQTIKPTEVMGEGEIGSSSTHEGKTMEDKIADEIANAGVGNKPGLW